MAASGIDPSRPSRGGFSPSSPTPCGARMVACNRGGCAPAGAGSSGEAPSVSRKTPPTWPACGEPHDRGYGPRIHRACWGLSRARPPPLPPVSSHPSRLPPAAAIVGDRCRARGSLGICLALLGRAPEGRGPDTGALASASAPARRTLGAPWSVRCRCDQPDTVPLWGSPTLSGGGRARCAHRSPALQLRLTPDGAEAVPACGGRCLPGSRSLPLTPPPAAGEPPARRKRVEPSNSEAK